jgi:hypothetical protein
VQAARQPILQTFRPLALAGLRFHQILTDLEFDVEDAAAFAVNRDGVVGFIADRVGLVVAEAPRSPFIRSIRI